MINKLALIAAERFIKYPNIKYDKIEIYQYGFFVLFSDLLFLAFSLIVGTLLNVLLSSTIFYFSFSLIRRFAGGYHAATETRCEILSTLSILACVVVIKLTKIYDFQTVLLIISAVAAVCILVLCPLDTPEKPLSEKEFKYFRKISWIILLVISIAAVISYCFKFNLAFAPCCMSLILESILLIAGKIKRVHQEKSVQS